MEVESFCSASVALVVETAMVTEKALFGLFLVIGSLNHGGNVFEKVHRTNEVLPLSHHSRVNMVDAETTVTEDDVKDDNDGYENDEEEVYSVSGEAGEEGTDGVEGDTEDDVEGNGNEGNDDRGENNDDDEDEDDDDDSDDEEEEEDEEEEWEEEDEDDDDDSDDDEPIFKHAKDVYKPEIFDLFEKNIKS